MEDYTIRFVFDRKNETGFRGKKKGVKYKDEALLQVEVRQDKTSNRAFVSTHVRLSPTQVSKENPLKIIDHDREKIVMSKARNIFRRIDAFASSDRCITVADIKNWDKEDQYLNENVIDFIRREGLRENAGKSLSTTMNFNSFINKLEEFAKIKIFKDVTFSNIADFDAYLRKDIKSQPTIYRRHKEFERYIKVAIKKKIMTNNPYDEFEVRKGKHKDPTFLTANDIKKLIDFTPTNDKLDRVKDMFLFQCFTGLAYVDMQSFSKDDIVIINESKAIRSSRTKTDESFIILVLPEVERILEKYDYKLPIISAQKYNDYLALLGTGAGINKNITSHMACHTNIIIS